MSGRERFEHWKQMSGERRRHVLNKAKGFWRIGSLLVIYGLVVSAVGLATALLFGHWWVLWVGLGMIGSGVPIWFVGMQLATGIASFEALEAAERLAATSPSD